MFIFIIPSFNKIFLDYSHDLRCLGKSTRTRLWVFFEAADCPLESFFLNAFFSSAKHWLTSGQLINRWGPSHRSHFSDILDGQVFRLLQLLAWQLLSASRIRLWSVRVCWKWRLLLRSRTGKEAVDNDNSVHDRCAIASHHRIACSVPCTPELVQTPRRLKHPLSRAQNSMDHTFAVPFALQSWHLHIWRFLLIQMMKLGLLWRDEWPASFQEVRNKVWEEYFLLFCSRDVLMSSNYQHPHAMHEIRDSLALIQNHSRQLRKLNFNLAWLSKYLEQLIHKLEVLILM